MDPRLQRIAGLLQSSLNSRSHKAAEDELKQEEKTAGFSLALLHIVATNDQSSTIRLAAALCFKNYLKREWIDADGNHRLPPAEVAAIKQEIVGLMIAAPPAVQSQLGDAIGIIADSDFWRDWDTLVPDLVSRLSADDYNINNGVLQVAHSIFKRWRPLFRSDELFLEINHVLEKFGRPFLSLLERTDALLQAPSLDPSRATILLTSMNLMIKIFYDLSCQDLPPIFEENISALVALMQKYLSYSNASLSAPGDDEAGILEYVKSSILEALTLYVQKYEDAFGPYVGSFVRSVWDLVTSLDPSVKFDILASRALAFLTSVSRIREHSTAFNDESNLSQVVEKVILPNLALRDSDLELFEDEPIEFIRRDLEGSDTETRRRAATDFLRALMVQFEVLVTTVVNRYVAHYLSEFAADRKANWRAKDTAIYLFSSIAAKGAVTARHGVTTINEQISVVDFFQQNVAADLTNEDEVEPILKVDAIKYLYVFRSQLDKEQWKAALPLLVHHLTSSNYVVYTYAAIAIERALALVDAHNKPLIEKSAIAPLAGDLLQHLFRHINKQQSTDLLQSAAKVQENEFLMRCIMRVLITLREDVRPLQSTLLNQLVSIIAVVATNPSNPRFCYFLFEALGALVRFSAASDISTLETTLQSPFGSILENDVQDFIPYVFQILSAMLEDQPKAPLSEFQKQLITPILKVDLWLAKGNVPALVRLLTALISRAPQEFVEANQIEPVLGIFERLSASRTNEVFAFELLECIFASFPKSAMENYYVPVIRIVLTKMDGQKSEALTTRFIKFYHFVSARVDEGLGADFFIQIVEQIQTNIFKALYLTIILPGTTRLIRPVDRKLAIISFTKTLTKSTAFAETYPKGWGLTCGRLLELLINPPSVADADEIMIENDVDDAAFGVGFTPLITVRRSIRDPWPEVTDAKAFVSQELRSADSAHGGRISSFLQQRLPPESQQALLVYMQA